MTNSRVRVEFAGEINGVKVRFFGVTVGGNNYKPGTFTNQRWSSSREYGDYTKLRVKIRFDDECRNGHNTFAITCDILELQNGVWRDVGGGAAHDDIVKAFPELEPLIKWHLVSTDGPMHYIANTVYHASDRDHRGKRAGEPCAWDKAIQFGDNPIKHKVKKDFWQFLKDTTQVHGHKLYDFEVIEYTHKMTHGDGIMRKYTFGGFANKWHECPFDTSQDALDFLEALNTQQVHFVQTPTLFSEGKERNLDAARNIAVWPEATDEELMQEPEELKKVLAARLPALLDEFKTDVEAAGFLWKPESE